MKIIIVLLIFFGSLNQNTMADTMQATIQQVKQQYESQLLSLPGVVSVGIGLDEKKTAVIIIGIASENSSLRAELPKQLEGYEVIIQVTGDIKTQ